MRENLPEKDRERPLFVDPRQPQGDVWENLDTSHSGHERNHLFLNTSEAGEAPAFVDISGVSGFDSPSDARAMVLWDPDRDGWLDLAICNANAPLLQLFRNRLGRSAAAADGRGRFVALRFVGGNHTAAPSERATRDGYGAQVVADLGDLTLHREHRCGEGFASQNSATMLLGIGRRPGVPALAVRWPSGVVREISDVPAGTLVTAYEEPSQSPSGEPFVLERYVRDETADGAETRIFFASASPRSRLRLYTTLSTTCAPCVKELPALARLRARFSDEELALYGVPTDEKDGAAELDAWMSAREPAYELLRDATRAELAAVERVLTAKLGLPDVLAATIVTDAHGRVLLTRVGPPSVSELRKLLAN